MLRARAAECSADPTLSSNLPESSYFTTTSITVASKANIQAATSTYVALFHCLAQVSRRLQNQHIQAFHEVWKIFV